MLPLKIRLLPNIHKEQNVAENCKHKPINCRRMQNLADKTSFTPQMLPKNNNHAIKTQNKFSFHRTLTRPIHELWTNHQRSVSFHKSSKILSKIKCIIIKCSSGKPRK